MRLGRCVDLFAPTADLVGTPCRRHPASSRGSRARLLAAIVRMKRDRTRFKPAIDGLGHATDGLGPAEGLLDALAVLLGQRVARVPGGAPVDGRVAGLPRDVGGVTQAWRRSRTKSALS